MVTPFFPTLFFHWCLFPCPLFSPPSLSFVDPISILIWHFFSSPYCNYDILLFHRGLLYCPPRHTLCKCEKIRPWIPAFLTHILRFCREGGVYKRYFWASASSETCAAGGSYFAYSVFLGVMLAWSMQSPESLFLTCNSFTSFSVLILLNHDE